MDKSFLGDYINSAIEASRNDFMIIMMCVASVQATYQVRVTSGWRSVRLLFPIKKARAL